MTEPNGFYYMRARYYDPEVGRFISEDPIGLAGGINVFIYASNNPILLIDPTGLVNWGRVGWGALETVGGIAIIGGTATATAATSGVGAIATAGLAVSGSAAFSHGTSEMILGFMENTNNPIPTSPPVSPVGVGTLAVTGNVGAAQNAELAVNTLLFGKSIVTAGMGNKSLWEGVGAATDFISLTNQYTSSGCGK